MRRDEAALRGFLDQLARRFHRAEYLSSDPLEFVHRYSDAWDQEAVALVAALLAYGNVKQIRRSVEDLLERMHREAGSPAAFMRLASNGASGVRAQCRALDGFVHRFNTGHDLAALCRLIGTSWERHRSVGALFLKGSSAADTDIGPGLNQLIGTWREWTAAWGISRDSSFHYLLTAPENGSCCKRWCMLLRWMGRCDELDPGLWTASSPLASTFGHGLGLRASQLVIPLDTHTSRITRYIGLTSRASTDWKTALEVTGALRALDAQDPVRFDFALARLGILDLCLGRYESRVCAQCELEPACGFARAGARRSSKTRGARLA